MRALLALVLATVAAAATGCYHDKYGLNGTAREDYVLPPDEDRYNRPDTAAYRAPPKAKQEDNLVNRARGGAMGAGSGGMGVGGL